MSLSECQEPEAANLSGFERRRSDAGEVAAATDVAEQSEHLREHSSSNPGEPRQGYTGRRLPPCDDPGGARGAVPKAQPTRPAPGSPCPKGVYSQAQRYPTAGPSHHRRSMGPSPGENRPGTILGSAVRGSRYGFRPGRGCHDAIESLFRLARPHTTQPWVVDAAIEGAAHPVWGSGVSALTEYVAHYQQERLHQDRGNAILIPLPSQCAEYGGSIRCREQLGGLLKDHDHEAA